MKLIINDKDVTNLIGKPIEVCEEIYIPISFLNAYQNDGVQITRSDGELKISIDPSVFLKLLHKENPFPVNLALTMDTAKNGKLNARAELGIGGLGKVSVDQDGKLEAGINFKLF